MMRKVLTVMLLGLIISGYIIEACYADYYSDKNKNISRQAKK
jgi:hypothetical protein